MVFRDLSETENKKGSSLKLASVSDRLVAFAIDVFIFSPVIQLAVAPVMKKIEVMSIAAPDSMELITLMAVAGALGLLSVVALQTFFVATWAATPGKLFLKLRVLAIDGQKKLSIAQAALRSLIWVFEIFFFFLPFLEVLSQRHRRPLHDRASESVVVTLKAQGDEGPHPLETQFVRQVLIVCAVFVSSWVFFGVARVYRLSLVGNFKKSELIGNSTLCPQVDTDSPNRVDEALALYLAKSANEDCVMVEADFAFWATDSGNKAWGYLAKAVVLREDHKLADVYLKKVCQENAQSEACEISKLLQEKSPGLKAAESLTARVLRIEQLDRQGAFADVAKEIQNLDHPSLVGYRIRHQIGSFWANHNLDQARGAFQVAIAALGPISKRDISSWMCLEELALECSPSSSARACSEIKKVNSETNLETAWAQIKSQACQRHFSEPGLTRYHDLMRTYPDFATLVQVVVESDSRSLAQREQTLRNLVVSSRGFVQSAALSEWIETAQTEKSWAEIQTELKKIKRRDWVWQRQVKTAWEKAVATGRGEKSNAFAKMLDEKVQNHWGVIERAAGARLPASTSAPKKEGP